MSFSAALRLNDIDDYIAPAQTCIKPILVEKGSETTTSIKIEHDGTYTATSKNGTTSVLKEAKISLNDCLACSGCITTAETVLVSLHSLESLLKILASNAINEDPRILVASISPQSIASIASQLRTIPLLAEAFDLFLSNKEFSDNKYLATFQFIIFTLKNVGFHIVLDTTWVRDIAISEAAKEFVDKYKKHSITSKTLPLFASVCPGWICYAEKSNGNLKELPGNKPSKFSILSHLSVVKSPQQIIGHAIKKIIEEVHCGDIYHVSVMPCFDKKLEASRSEFKSTLENDDKVLELESDIDLVLATNEFLEFLLSIYKCPGSGDEPNKRTVLLGRRLSLFERLCDLFAHNTEIKEEELITNKCSEVAKIERITSANIYRHPGSGSGGYAMSILHVAAIDIFNIQLEINLHEDQRLFLRQLNNKDLQELMMFSTAEDCELAKNGIQLAKNLGLGNHRMPIRQLLAIIKEKDVSEKCYIPVPLLVFAICNGFRNIQSILHQLKLQYRQTTMLATKQSLQIGEFPFDYIEVMACPGGCLNGGGQLKNTLNETLSIYNSLSIRIPMSSDLPRRLYCNLSVHKSVIDCLHTTYREIEPMNIISPAALSW